MEAKTSEELAARRGGLKVGKGKLQSVEGKDEYRSRTGENSPDRADACLLLVHGMRIATAGLVPKAKDTEEVKEGVALAAWSGFNQVLGGAKLDALEVGDAVDMMRD